MSEPGMQPQQDPTPKPGFYVPQDRRRDNGCGKGAAGPAAIGVVLKDHTDGPQARQAAVAVGGRKPQPRAAWLGAVLRYGNSGQKFGAIDAYVHERLAILASAKHGLQGRNWVSRFNYESYTSLGIYRLTGPVKPTTAYASR